jgi:hypothetical protein
MRGAKLPRKISLAGIPPQLRKHSGETWNLELPIFPQEEESHNRQFRVFDLFWTPTCGKVMMSKIFYKFIKYQINAFRCSFFVHFSGILLQFLTA